MTTMSFFCCIYHIVFATHNRQATISLDKEREVYAIIYHILCKNNCRVYRIGGMPDHLHLLIEIPPTISVSALIQNVKRESSLTISQNKILPVWEGWQDGYGCFTYGKDAVQNIIHYIASQKDHHRFVSFIEEYQKWLSENGVSSDDPYFPK